MSFRGSIDDERGGLLGELTAGFEALMQKADELVCNNTRLSERLHALQIDFLKRNTPNETSSSSSNSCDCGDLSLVPDWRHDPTVSKGIQAWKLLKIATMPAVPLRKDNRSTSHENQEHQNARPQPFLQLPVTLESDFTTEGPKGGLKCPFSRRGAALCGNPHRLPDPNPFAAKTHSEEDPAVSPDPIAREFHANVKDEVAEPETIPPKCPIRFIDQHTPEEVAKYVEKHKHEIPRSHEVCVRRYQANEASIRTLDAKYGSLVKMIQGLSEKHKPMLPADAPVDDNGEPILDGRSMEKVEQWAKEVPNGETPVPLVETGSQRGSEGRTGHFERPLEEVRLGESPSRPWGIRVPYDEVPERNSEVPNSARRSRLSSIAPPANAPVHESEAMRAAGKCPFANDLPGLGHPDAPHAEPAPKRSHLPQHPTVDQIFSSSDKETSRIIFTGPVFFGYSAEDAAALMGVLPGWRSRGDDNTDG